MSRYLWLLATGLCFLVAASFFPPFNLEPVTIPGVKGNFPWPSMLKLLGYFFLIYGVADSINALLIFMRSLKKNP